MFPSVKTNKPSVNMASYLNYNNYDTIKHLITKFLRPVMCFRNLFVSSDNPVHAILDWNTRSSARHISFKICC